MPERVGGPPPPDRPPDKKSKKSLGDEYKEAQKKVEKVREISPDERGKRRRFRPESEEIEEKPDEGKIEPKTPSPYDTSFYVKPSKGEDVTSSAPPPRAPTEPEDSQGLPTSPDFWEEEDFPEGYSPPPSPQDRSAAPSQKEDDETTGPTAKKGEPAHPGIGKKDEKKPGAPREKEKGFFPGEKIPSHKKKDVAQFPFLKEEKKGGVGKKVGEEKYPEMVPKKPSKKTPMEELPVKKEKTTKGELQAKIPSKKEEEKKPFTPTPKHKEKKAEEEPFPPSFPAEPGTPSSPIKEKKEEGKPLQIDQMALQQTMHPSVLAAASQAATQVKPYLSPEVVPLFHAMVGVVITMSREGISQTQVLLNAPSFSASIFYGSTITIERYSTAPDSFNIRFTGSTQAVNVFNANIEGLMNAFKRGNFNFRIGRLDASYAPERPLFKRKESTGGKEMGGEGPPEK